LLGLRLDALVGLIGIARTSSLRVSSSSMCLQPAPGWPLAITLPSSERAIITLKG
jgi:hypothetical protein